MAKAVKSELSGGSIAGMISLLEGEATNTDNLISSINSFINDSTSTLVGESYNAVRQKLGLYLQDVQTRQKISAELATAISQGAASLESYMEEFAVLDDSEIQDIESEINNLNTQISNARATISRLSSTSGEGTTIDTSTYSQQISSWEATKTELERKLDKLINLGGADSAAFGQVQSLAGEVAKYGASVDGIQVSSITLNS